jgi:D-alanyl-lipoteichoic acid acyltransferase DltB (MBOAT superfamily)
LRDLLRFGPNIFCALTSLSFFNIFLFKLFKTDLYDVHCLSDSSQFSPSSCVDPEGAIFSRFLYTRWVANSPNREISNIPLSKCLNLCSTGGEQLRVLLIKNYFRV